VTFKVDFVTKNPPKTCCFYNQKSAVKFRQNIVKMESPGKSFVSLLVFETFLCNFSSNLVQLECIKLEIRRFISAKVLLHEQKKIRHIAAKDCGTDASKKLMKISTF
jgi:hypothetical protein